MAPARPWLRSPFVGAVVGVFAGGVAILLIEALGHGLLDTADPADFSDVTAPMFLAVLVAWVVGAAVAALVATTWARSASSMPGTLAGLVLVAGAVSTMLAIPHPAWMWGAAVLLMPAAAATVARMASTPRSA